MTDIDIFDLAIKLAIAKSASDEIYRQFFCVGEDYLITHEPNSQTQEFLLKDTGLVATILSVGFELGVLHEKGKNSTTNRKTPSTLH